MWGLNPVELWFYKKRKRSLSLPREDTEKADVDKAGRECSPDPKLA